MEIISQIIAYLVDSSQWFTVPFDTKIYRKSDGSKQVPTFKTGWKQYRTERNTDYSKGLALILKQSGLLALDLDSTTATEFFKDVLPADYPYRLPSVGKMKNGVLQECSTYLFKADNEITRDYKHSTDKMSFDVLTQNLVFLPNEYNTTKSAIPLMKYIETNGFPEVQPIPPSLKERIVDVMKQHSVSQIPSANQRTPQEDASKYASNIGRNIANHLKSTAGIEKYFKRIVPSRYKGSFFTVHDVIEGVRNDFMYAVGCKLSSDPTVDETTYKVIMQALNSSIPSPLEPSEFVNIMTSIASNLPFVYDKTLDSVETLYYVLDRANFETGEYDTHAIPYFCQRSSKWHLLLVDGEDHNKLKRIIHFKSASDFKEKIGKYIQEEEKPADVVANALSGELFYNYRQPTGFNNSTDYYNVVSTSKYMDAITSNSKIHIEPNIYTQALDKYLERAIDKQSLNWLLSFLKTKLLTYATSPQILVFLGKQGTGKTTLASLITSLVPQSASTNFESDGLLEKFNSWIEGCLFAVLDETMDTLKSTPTKLYGSMKRLSGGNKGSKVSLRKMFTDTNENQTEILLHFLLPVNRLKLDLTIDDRRVTVFDMNKTADPNVVGLMYGQDGFEEDVLAAFTNMIIDAEPLSNGDFHKIPPFLKKNQEKVLSQHAKLSWYIETLDKDRLQELLCSEKVWRASCKPAWDTYKEMIPVDDLKVMVQVYKPKFNLTPILDRGVVEIVNVNGREYIKAVEE